MPGMFAQLKEAHILLVQWKIIGAMKNKGKNRVTFSTKKTPCNINNRKVNNPCTICLRHGWCFSQTCPIQMLNEIRDWLHSRHHKVSSKPVKLAFWLALGRCFVTSKKYDWNLIMPKNWTTLAMSSFSLSNGSYIFTNNGIWLFQWTASCGWKNYLLNVAQKKNPHHLVSLNYNFTLHSNLCFIFFFALNSARSPWNSTVEYLLLMMKKKKKNILPQDTISATSWNKSTTKKRSFTKVWTYYVQHYVYLMQMYCSCLSICSF